MDDLLVAVPLAGRGVVLGLTAATGALVVLAVLLQHRARRGRRPVTVLAAVVALLAAGAAVNTRLDAYPTLADVFGIDPYPAVSELHPTTAEQQDGAAAEISVPDTASHFGRFQAEVWLPPQYFTEPTRRFPVMLLLHGNPGRSSDWLGDGSAALTGLTVARSGRPVILVMPTVLQQPTGDSLCVDTELEGYAETYVTQDVVAAADSQLRTLPGAAHRGIGGFSMGGFCALNLGLKHPDVFSVVLSFSSLTVCEPDAIEGGNQELFGGEEDWHERVAANSPAVYYPTLDARRGPALWLDVGEEETELVAPLEMLSGELAGRGFTVEYHERPGGHDFATWGAALAQSLPWAAARLSS